MDLLDISLRQGNQFNDYQRNIKKNMIKSNRKKREGFVTQIQQEQQEQLVRPIYDGYSPVIKNTNNASSVTTISNQQDLTELNKLRSKYDSLIQQYNSVQDKINNEVLSDINQMNSNNPYLNKIIQFTTGQIGYVTNKGVVKYIPSDEIKNSVNIPLNVMNDVINVNIPWVSAYNIQGTVIPTNPPLISGTNVTKGQTLGNEGTNVYASTLINNPSSTYIGCFNDKPEITNVNVVPIMNSNNSTNGFISYASSVYKNNPNNKNNYGPWAAFDQNLNTYWHSDVSSSSNYNPSNGTYNGIHSVNVANIGVIGGEFLQINMPKTQNIQINQYSITPRTDSGLLTTRNPNSWYILGYNNNQWTQIDRQQNQQFTNSSAKIYDINNPTASSAYILLVDKVGNDDKTNNRTCVQVAGWNLYTNSDSMFVNNEHSMASASIIGYATFDKCQEFAVDNSYSYFGLQNTQPDGTAVCVVSNDIDKVKLYGNANNSITLIPVWATNTSGSNATYAMLEINGRLFVSDDSKKVIWESSPPPQSKCDISYSVSDRVSYIGNNLSYSTNTPLEICRSKCTMNNNCRGFVINDNNECWIKSKLKMGVSDNNKTAYKKINEHKNCKYMLVLQDDGNLCIYQYDKTPDNIIKPAIWTSKTTGQSQQTNVDWNVSKNSFGRNYIIGGESLSKTQWISSNNGAYNLTMQSDGNLVLYTFETNTSCKTINNKTYGNGWVNAVYQTNEIGNKNVLGKIGYVDDNSVLKEYPDSMVGFTNDYQIYQNTDLTGNDITSMVAQTQDNCQASCDNNVDCAAFVYQSSSQTCWLKNREAFPNSKKQQNDNVVLGVRKPALKGGNCPTKIANIDSVQYDNYLKGVAMTANTKCNAPVISHKEQVRIDNIKNQLITLGNDIASKMENLYNQDNRIIEKLNVNNEQFKKVVENYKLTNLMINPDFKLKSSKSNDSINLNNFNNNIVEGMQNLYMNDLNGMLVDSELWVLQEHYKLMLSILVLGIILFISIKTFQDYYKLILSILVLGILLISIKTLILK